MPRSDHATAENTGFSEPEAAGVYSIEASRNFASWLAENHCSIAVSTRQHGALFLLGLNKDGALCHSRHPFADCSALHVNEDRFWVAARNQLWRFAPAPAATARFHTSDYALEAEKTCLTGDLKIHGMAETDAGELLFVNTLYSCVAIPGGERGFIPVWQPDFIQKLTPEDRCHLSGLAMRDGKPYAVTAASCTDIAQGWRKYRQSGGVVIEMAGDALMCEGLTMPHSPRWTQDRLWVLDSGKGSLGYVDPASGRLEEIAFCPGYARGMGIIDRFAVIGLSHLREGAPGNLALSSRLDRYKVTSRCGLIIVDLESGSVVEWLRINGTIQELFDVAVLPQTRQPLILTAPQRAGERSDARA